MALAGVKYVSLCAEKKADPVFRSDIDVCGLLGSPSGELGPAVISRINTKSGDYYENT